MRAYLVLLFNKLMKYGRDHVETTIAISKFEIYYQRILEYLSQNFRTATLESTAQAIFFSKQYLCKIIRTVSGKSFSNLLAEVRIEKVKQLISENSYSLEIIAEFSGFSDAAHLSRTFKKITGISPSAYRRECGHNK